MSQRCWLFLQLHLTTSSVSEHSFSLSVFPPHRGLEKKKWALCYLWLLGSEKNKKSNLVVCKPSIVDLPHIFTRVCVCACVRAWGCWKLSAFTWILIFIFQNLFLIVSHSGVTLLFYKALWRVMFNVHDFIFNCSKTRSSSRGSIELMSYIKAYVTSSFDEEFLLPS